MAFDRIWFEIGQLGKFQKYSLLLLWPVSIFFAFNAVGMVFLGATPDFHCQIPAILSESNISREISLELCIPLEEKDGIMQRSQCKIYDRNYTAIALHQDTLEIGNQSQWSDDITGCNHYHFYGVHRTIVNQWDLVCDRKWLLATAQSSFMLGYLFGCIFFGDIADRFGRRFTIVVSAALQVVSGIATAFSPSYVPFVVLRFVVAMATAGCRNSAYIMAMELVGPSWRGVAGMLHEFFWSFGYLLLGGLAYFIHSWVYLQLAITIPAIFFVSYHWLLPESPRWLLSKGKEEEARTVLRRIAKLNKREYPAKMSQIIDEEKNFEKKLSGSILDLVRTSEMRKLSFKLWFVWCVGSMVYFGVSFHAATLAGSIFVNFLISGAVELPGYIVAILCSSKFGRRVPLMSGMVLGGLACLGTAVVPSGYPGVAIALATTGKFGVLVFFAIIYTFTAELYPTPVRNIGLGAGSFFARIGAIIAPYIGLLGDVVKPLPFVIYGLLTLAAGLLSLRIPETLGQPLPDTIHDAEAFMKENQPSFKCFCASKQKKDEVTNDKPAFSPVVIDEMEVIQPEMEPLRDIYASKTIA